MRKRLLAAAALSVTLLTGCDNVQWGGAEIAIIPPPPKAASAGAEAVSAGGERLPNGPLLFYVTPAGTGATIVPVAEVAGDALRPLQPAKDWRAYGTRFIAEFMRRGAEFALYHDGARVGTFVMQSASLPQSWGCTPLPLGVGIVELAPGTAAPAQMLALPKTQAPEIRNRLNPALAPTRGMQIVAPILAERLLRARHAQLPGNWQRAMAQLQPFPLAGAVDPAFSATFLVGDTMGLGPSYGSVAYSLFFIATPQGNVGYDTSFVEFHNYPQGGKAAPRVVDYLDWNRDEQVELLALVYGETQSYFEAYGKKNRDFVRIFQQKCVEQSAMPPVAGGAETAPAGENAARAVEAAKAGAAATAAAAGTTSPAATPGLTTTPGAAPAPRRPRLLGEPVTGTPARPDTSHP